MKERKTADVYAKKIVEIISLSVILLGFTFFCTGCEYLQGTLSTVQQEKLLEATGSPSYDYKVWYYNGMSGENMSLSADSSTDEYFSQTLRINFGQKVALKAYAPSGKIIVNYTDFDGNNISKTISKISGRLSPDYESYYLDMSPVTKLISGTTSSATVDIKLSGFVCAAGEQNGRPLKAFEYSSLQIRPLYSALSFDYSTVGFSKSSSFKIPMNGAFSLAGGSYKVVGKDASSKEYTFIVSADKNAIYLSPDFVTEPADQTSMVLELSGILADGAGEAYSKKIKVRFLKHLIVIDGLEDSNWEAANVVTSEDASGDAMALGDDGIMYATSADITKLSVANDDDYLYLAIKGGLTSSWGDGFALMISKDHSSNVVYTEGSKSFKVSDSLGFGRDSLAHGTPDLYLYHKPQNEILGAWVEKGTSPELSTEDISSSIECAVDSSETFIEYAIPLTKLASAGIKNGDQIFLGAFFSAHWDAGIFAADVVPDSLVSSSNESHSSVVLNFKNGLAYTVK